MVGHGGSSAGSYLADPTSTIPSQCASIVATSTLRVKTSLHYHTVCSRTVLTNDEWYYLKHNETLVCYYNSASHASPIEFDSEHVNGFVLYENTAFVLSSHK